MSLKKLLMKEPGNFREFLEVAEQNNSSVGVMFISEVDADVMGGLSIHGHVNYSCMGKDSRGKTKRYNLNLYPGGSLRNPETDEKMIKELYKSQESNLSLLDKKKIHYDIKYNSEGILF